MTEIISKRNPNKFQKPKVTKSKIAEIHNFDDASDWWKASVAFISYDEKTNKEKQTISQMLVMANNAKDVYEKVVLKMTGTMADYTIPSISLSKIVDILEYDPNDLPKNLKGFDELEN